MSTVSKKQFKQLIENFDFINLFNHLGWNYITGQDTVKVGLETFYVAVRGRKKRIPDTGMQSG